jgi:hypothetical protein
VASKIKPCHQPGSSRVTKLFDLKDDPDEVRNLALDREKNSETILRLNARLNDLMTREVGANDGKFLPEVVRPKKPPMTFEGP